MAKKRYTLADVEGNLRNVADVMGEKDNKGISVVDLLNANHTLMWWVLAHGKDFLDTIRVPNRGDFLVLTAAFWSLCAEFGIELDLEQKREVFEKFISD